MPVSLQKTSASKPAVQTPQPSQKDLEKQKSDWNGKKVFASYAGWAAVAIGAIALGAFVYYANSSTSSLPVQMNKESPHACELGRGMMMEHSTAEHEPYSSYWHPTSMVSRLVDCSLNKVGSPEGSTEFQRSECGVVAGRYHTVCTDQGSSSSPCKEAFKQMAQTCFLSNGLFEAEQKSAADRGCTLTLTDEGVRLDNEVILASHRQYNEDLRKRIAAEMMRSDLS